MRVEVLESLPKREGPEVDALPDAAVERALKNFFAAVDTDDSLFAAESAGVRLGGAADTERVCVGTLVLKFRDEKLLRNREAQFSLIEKLSELLKQAGSADSLEAVLALSGDGEKTRQPEFALRLRLQAKGNSPEQAALRWGLGLAHVQQALLFTSRLLRQQLTQG
jgi:hypothetical protein